MTSSGDPSPLAISVSPHAGRSYRATRDLSKDTCVLDISTPYTCTIYKRFRTEACAECWRYECGRRGFLTCRDFAEAGLLFCDQNCRDAWLAREGEETVKLLKGLEGVRMRNEKGKAKETASYGSVPLTAEAISHAWEQVALEEKHPKILNKWKGIQLDDFEADLARYVLLALVHLYREDSSKTTVGLHEPEAPQDAPASNVAVVFGASWREFAALQSGELQQVSRFPELLENHTRIYKALKSRFPPRGTPLSPEAAKATSETVQLADVITTENVRTALAVDPGNSFGVWQTPITEESEGLGFGVYPVPSFFNHSCSPNVRKERVGRRLRFVTTRDIQTGEELCITYGHVEGMGLDERRKHLREGWFFDCQCARCTAEEGVRYSRPMERSNECKTPRQDSCQSLPICVARESADVGWAEGQGCQ